MPDLPDADREWGGHVLCGRGVGSAGADDGSSGSVCEDGGGVSEGAAGNSRVGLGWGWLYMSVMGWEKASQVNVQSVGLFLMV